MNLQLAASHISGRGNGGVGVSWSGSHGPDVEFDGEALEKCNAQKSCASVFEKEEY